jgi:glycerophosphoryl diester phosphodiesterase
MISNFPTPAIFAHRGASKYAPENTLAAFELALEQQADGIELDVRLTVDDRVAVIHDASLNRTTNGRGRISHQTLQEIQQWDAGEGQKIPSLEEVLALVSDQAILNIELKGNFKTSNRLPEIVINLVKNHRLTQSVILSSFDPNMLLFARQVMPEICLGYLYSPRIISRLKYKMYTPRIQPYSLHPHGSLVSPRLLDRAQSQDIKVLAWTINIPEDMSDLFAMGIDGIITNDPLTATQVREKIR